MEKESLLQASRDQLNTVLSFFPRVDAKASVVLAVDTGMLAFLAANMPPFRSFAWWEVAICFTAVLLLAASFWHLYKGAFPNLEGGNLSLIYFREVAMRTESKFIDEFSKQNEGDYVKDVLGQVWRNSGILTEKFNHLKSAFLFLALAVPPWVAALAIFVAKRTQRPTK